MSLPMKTMPRTVIVAALCNTLLLLLPGFSLAQGCGTTSRASVATAAMRAPELDMSILHYSRVMSTEGVLREVSFEENMLRRSGHVWVFRVLPESVRDESAIGNADPLPRQARGGFRKAAITGKSKADKPQGDKYFNPAVLPRHVICDGDRIRLEFVNPQAREIVSIAPTEYENVNFDGSWFKAFFLIDPRSLAALPRTGRPSAIPGTYWREQQKDGVFQRVLWDETRMIPLVMESGNRKGTFFQRIEVTPLSSLVATPPWQQLTGYAHREYADFLD